jgi:hypothetical protein
VGAYFGRWAIRRRTWRSPILRKPLVLPPNGQILSLVALFGVTLVLSLVGPDYIAPDTAVFDFSQISKRDSTPPQSSISKSWWTSGARTGLIAFALYPLCVLLALRAPPFAVFALSFTTHLSFDKLAWLHKWSGRFIFVLAVAHVVSYLLC